MRGLRWERVMMMLGVGSAKGGRSPGLRSSALVRPWCSGIRGALCKKEVKAGLRASMGLPHMAGAWSVGWLSRPRLGDGVEEEALVVGMELEWHDRDWVVAVEMVVWGATMGVGVVVLVAKGEGGGVWGDDAWMGVRGDHGKVERVAAM